MNTNPINAKAMLLLLAFNVGATAIVLQRYDQHLGEIAQVIYSKAYQRLPLIHTNLTIAQVDEKKVTPKPL